MESELSNNVDNELWRRLSAVGLEDKEARLYLTVLEAGRLSVSEAAERTYISRTNAYDIVRRLSRKNLLQAVEVADSATQRSRILLQANDLEELLEDIAVRRDRIEALVPLLRAVRAKGKSPRVRHLEGVAGIRHALFESLEWSSPIYGILSMADLVSVPGAGVMNEYIAGRQEHELELRVVRSSPKEFMLNWPTDPTEFRVVRLAPEPYIFTMTTLIGENTVSTLSSRRENFAMIIESGEYATLQRQLFEILWHASTPI